MTTSTFSIRKRDEIELQIQSLLESLGEGRVDGVAYDTAWAARLALRYPNYGFDQSLEWLRRHQYPDGTWGAPLTHYHDRYISTLAAIVALQEALKEGGGHPRDARRVKRGEDVLWKLVGKLGRDDSDTVGFPVLATSLTEEATKFGLDVPQPPVRHAGAYKKKVKALLNQSNRDWRKSPLSFSLEAMREAVQPSDIIQSDNHSVAASPSATTALLLTGDNDLALSYVCRSIENEGTGSTPALNPIDLFEIAWSLIHLRAANAISPTEPVVQKLLEHVWKSWDQQQGASYSSFFSPTDVDGTAACYTVLKWGGYPVIPDAFANFEMENHFCCYPAETDPSVSVHVRLLTALELIRNTSQGQKWTQKVIDAFALFDQNGAFWWDKWHASPYYVSSTALAVLNGLSDNLAASRLKWILKTQNDDGGWGYLGSSTPEETAYCLLALVNWNANVSSIENSILDAAAAYLQPHANDNRFEPLWIGKSLYTPHYPVKAAVLSALYSYYEQVT